MGVGQASGFASFSGRKRPNSSAHLKRSLTSYFARGCFSIFLFRAANEALIGLATPDVAFWQNEPNVPVLAKRTHFLRTRGPGCRESGTSGQGGSKQPST